MPDPAIEQELTDASTSMEVAREAAKKGDKAMMLVALKDLRKRVGRVLKAIEPQKRPYPALPREPVLPIKDGRS